MALYGVCALVVYVELAGWFLYKLDLIQGENWWDATKKMVNDGIRWIWKNGKKLFEQISEELTGQTSPDKIEKKELILSAQECLKLIKEFSGNPYEEPTLASYQYLDWGALKIDVYALGLIEKYKDLNREELKTKIRFIVRNFYLATREKSAFLHFETISPQRLTMVLALSPNAERKIRERQKSEVLEVVKQNILSKNLKECVPDESKETSKSKSEPENET